jgi:hypothetical protein
MQIIDTPMNYENIYEGFYTKYYTKVEYLIKKRLIKHKSEEIPFFDAFGELTDYFNNYFINKYNFNKNENLENLYQIFCNRRFVSPINAVEVILSKKLKICFDNIEIAELPPNYTYLKLIKEIALIEVEKEISRLLSNNLQLIKMFYRLNEFDEFEIRLHENLAIEDFPIYRKLAAKLYPENYKRFNINIDDEVVDCKEIDLYNTSAVDNIYLGQSSNEKANELFDYLIQYYRPEEKTSVKFINILHYLKNDANKQLYIFNLKQPEFKEIIKTKFKIEIKKFAKSERYHDDEKSILNTLESSFRNKKG